MLKMPITSINIDKLMANSKTTIISSSMDKSIQRLQCNNLAIWLNKDIVQIKGSIQKYITGVNYGDVNIASVNDVLMSFCCDYLKDLNTVTVCKLEYGKNIATAKPVVNYLELFYLKSRYESDYVLTKGVLSSVTYKTMSNRQSFIVYDKGLESKLKGVNLIRLEYRLSHAGLKQVFNRPIRINDLLNMDTHRVLISKFMAFYNSIQKNGGVLSMDNTSKLTVKGFNDNVLDLFKVQYPMQYNSYLQQAINNNQLDKRSVERIKSKDKALFCSNKIIGSELIAELNQKLVIS